MEWNRLQLLLLVRRVADVVTDPDSDESPDFCASISHAAPDPPTRF
jgi:hypothetical protein